MVSAFTVVLFVIAFTLMVLLIAIEFNSYMDRRDSRRRNQAHKQTRRR